MSCEDVEPEEDGQAQPPEIIMREMEQWNGAIAPAALERLRELLGLSPPPVAGTMWRSSSGRPERRRGRTKSYST